MHLSDLCYSASCKWCLPGQCQCQARPQENWSTDVLHWHYRETIGGVISYEIYLNVWQISQSCFENINLSPVLCGPRSGCDMMSQWWDQRSPGNKTNQGRAGREELQLNSSEANSEFSQWKMIQSIQLSIIAWQLALGVFQSSDQFLVINSWLNVHCNLHHINHFH